MFTLEMTGRHHAQYYFLSCNTRKASKKEEYVTQFKNENVQNKIISSLYSRIGCNYKIWIW